MKRLHWLIPNLKDDGEVEDYEGDARSELEEGEIVPESEANIVSSMLVNSMHAPALDIDGIEVRVVPSTTQGNYHLYIDKQMTWEQYKRLLYVLADVGIIERNYLNASVAKGQTFLRKPGVKKGGRSHEAQG